MKSLFYGAAVSVVSAFSASAAITVPTTGVYDVTANPNAVDTVAGIGAVTTGSAAETALNNYKNLFSTAFSTNMGGVIQFDGFSGSPVIQNTMTTTYGSNTLNITRIGGTGNFQFDSSPTTLGTPISGTMYLRSESQNFHTFNFSSGLSAVGFTVLSRNSSRTIQATVTYVEGGTEVISGELVSAGATVDDTFFGFTAPTGKTIQSLRVEATATGSTEDPVNYFFAIDDLGYVVAVPEPSTGLISMAGALLVMVANRRRVVR